MLELPPPPFPSRGAAESRVESSLGSFCLAWSSLLFLLPFIRFLIFLVVTLSPTLKTPGDKRRPQVTLPPQAASPNMAVFTLAQLSGMKRAQLQSLCKVSEFLRTRLLHLLTRRTQENELKANGKTEVLIQQLLDLYAPSPPGAPSHSDCLTPTTLAMPSPPL